MRKSTRRKIEELLDVAVETGPYAILGLALAGVHEPIALKLIGPAVVAYGLLIDVKQRLKAKKKAGRRKRKAEATA